MLASGCSAPYGLYSWLFASVGYRFHALVWEDGKGQYQAVLPLIVGYKWGFIPYVRSWPFVQRLGLFARPGFEANLGKASLYLRLRFARLQLTCWQEPGALGKYFKTRPAANLALPLNQPPEALRKGYAKGLRENLKRAAALELRPLAGGGASWSLFHQQVAPRIQGWSRYFDGGWLRLCLLQNPHYHFEHWGAFEPGAAEPLAVASFAFFNHRIFYLLGATTPEGRDQGASALLLQSVIERYAADGSLWTLDFEGGIMPGTGQFFRSFGAAEEAYWVMEG